MTPWPPTGSRPWTRPAPAGGRSSILGRPNWPLRTSPAAGASGPIRPFYLDLLAAFIVQAYQERPAAIRAASDIFENAALREAVRQIEKLTPAERDAKGIALRAELSELIGSPRGTVDLGAVNLSPPERLKIWSAAVS